MKKIVFAAILACSTVASAQFSMDLPNLWWPEEFTQPGEPSAEEKSMVLSSKNVKLYMKREGLGSILDVVKSDDNKLYVIIEGGSFQVVIRKNATPAVRPVKGTLFVD